MYRGVAFAIQDALKRDFAYIYILVMRWEHGLGLCIPVCCVESGHGILLQLCWCLPTLRGSANGLEGASIAADCE